MTIPQNIGHLVNPGTEVFIEKYTRTVEDVFQMIAEDRLRNLVCAGGFKEAREIGLRFLKKRPLSKGIHESGPSHASAWA